MKISGFGMSRNATKLYYPVKESVASILPIVDEFVFALGKGDEDDYTRKELLSLNSDKLRIIDTEWDIEKYPSGMENAHQTDIAREACTGDWLIYLQADELIHEKYHSEIITQCKKYKDNSEVDGLLLNYHHFYGDYNHIAYQHGWYQKEIRVIKNDPDIHSFWSAQSFRKIKNFDGHSYKTKEGTEKLTVVPIDAYVYHYGWVRPPEYMQSKSKSLDTIHKGVQKADQLYSEKSHEFDYGNMHRMEKFNGTHPAVLEDWVDKFNWEHKLNFEKSYKPRRELMKHERLKYRILTWIEKNLNGGKHIFAYKNWNIYK